MDSLVRGRFGNPKDVITLNRVPPLMNPIINEQTPAVLSPTEEIVVTPVGSALLAIPRTIMEQREVVHVNGNSVTFCPFTGCAAAYPLPFSTTGLVYNSNVLLYDHTDGSLLCQLLGLYVKGPKRGVMIPRTPAIVCPYSSILSISRPETAFADLRGYGSNISYVHGARTDSEYDWTDDYAGYRDSKATKFPVAAPFRAERRLHPKDTGYVDFWDDSKEFVPGLPATFGDLTALLSQRHFPVAMYAFAHSAFERELKELGPVTRFPI